MARPRLLLADDHAETLDLLRGLLEPEFDVVAGVTDGPALVAAAEDLSPDVIVTDVSMPGFSGIGAASAILSRDSSARIVLISVYGDPCFVRSGLDAGAMAYVLKLAAGDELVEAVRAALRGERYVSAVLSEHGSVQQAVDPRGEQRRT